MTSQPTSGLKLPHRYLGPGPRLILGLPSTSGNGGRAVRKRYIERSSRFAEIVEGIVKGLKTPGRFERALLLETVTHPFRPLRRPIFVARGGSHQPPEYRTFRCRESALLPHYLAELVKTEWFWSKLATITRGVGARRERTRPEHFLEMRVEMPTRDAQTAILTTLRSIRRASILRSDLTEIRALVPAMISYSFSRE